MIKKLKDNPIIVLVIAVVVILGLVWGGVALAGGFNTDNGSETPNNTNETVTSEKVEKTVSGKTIDEDRKDALNAATEILNLANGPSDGDEFSSILTKLDEGDLSVVDESLDSKIRFTDIYADSNDLKANVYQALITFSSLIKKTTDTEEIKPASDTLWKEVFVDSELGIAQVPMTVYMGQQASFAMEMVYVDGQWQLAPYSLIEQIKLSASMQPAAE